MSGERCGRLAEKLRSRTLVDRSQRSPMNRYRNSWSKQRQSFRGAQWIQVTWTKARAPAPDGNQSKVQVRDEAGHPVEDVGIPGEVDALGAQDRVAEGSGRSPRRPAAVVGVGRSNDHRTDVHLVALHDLAHVGKPKRLEHAAETAREDDRGVGRQLTQ